ncbi:hypothetical protein PG996_009206 [Apiospora saccharicola]|uniref:Uncharacterized protein n=1 Tax=Apiospora saccharicola TaxID=335842 RepID=A0ABR1UK41_9PEZI
MANSMNPPPQSESQPQAAPKLHEHVLRKKYRSQVKLKEALDGMFGKGSWEVKAQLQSLDRDVYQHYEAERPPSEVLEGKGEQFDDG